MKKVVQRERKLPAFSLSIGELEALWSRLTALFDDPADICGSIQIRLPLEQLEFANPEELRQYPHLPSRVTNFHVRLSDLQKGHRVVISSGKPRHFRAEVSATAETEAWCGGAVEAVFSFVQSHKLGYAWFLSAPVFCSLYLLVPISMLFLMAYYPHPVATTVIPKGVVIGWLAAFILVPLIFYNERLLPSAVIRISVSEGFVRKHAAELGLAIAVVSVIVAVIGWFVAK